jgi:hypothetical protein
MRKIKIIVIMLFIGLTLAPSPSLARQTFNSHQQNLNVVTAKAGSEKIELRDFFSRVVVVAFALTGLSFMILITYAGFRWMTAKGEADMVNKAKNTIVGATIGLVLVVSAYAITSFVSERLLSGKNATSSGGTQTLGGEPLGCCIDRVGSGTNFINIKDGIDQFACAIKTESSCATAAKETSSGDIYTEFEWKKGLNGAQCSESCKVKNGVTLTD